MNCDRKNNRIDLKFTSQDISRSNFVAIFLVTAFCILFINTTTSKANMFKDSDTSVNGSLQEVLSETHFNQLAISVTDILFDKDNGTDNKGSNEYILKWSDDEVINFSLYDNYSTESGSAKEDRLSDKINEHINFLQKSTGISIKSVNKKISKEATLYGNDPGVIIELSDGSGNTGNEKNKYQKIVYSLKIADIKGYSTGSLYECFIYFDDSYKIRKVYIAIYPRVILGVVPYSKFSDLDLRENLRDVLIWSFGLKFDSNSVKKMISEGITKEMLLKLLYSRYVNSEMGKDEVLDIVKKNL